MKYKEPVNKNWYGAEFYPLNEGEKGHQFYRKTARCRFCNKFFNWVKLVKETKAINPPDIQLPYLCPHCNNKVYEF